MPAQLDDTPRFATYPSLAGRVVLISGGASGIGESLVEHFVHQQAIVAFLDVQEEAGEALAARLAREGHEKPSFHHCDLTDIDALQSVAKDVLVKFGRIDVLVNNAANDVRHSVAEVSSEHWDELIAVNLKHQFFLCQAVLPAMRAAGRGSIINMSSISWQIPSVGLPVYITAKAGIVGLTRTLAHEVGVDGVRVNCVMPGAILTEKQRRLWFTEQYKTEILSRQALKRMLLPEEVARLVLFLAADDSSAITNQSYIVDGGWV